MKKTKFPLLLLGVLALLFSSCKSDSDKAIDAFAESIGKMEKELEKDPSYFTSHSKEWNEMVEKLNQQSSELNSMKDLSDEQKKKLMQLGMRLTVLISPAQEALMKQLKEQEKLIQDGQKHLDSLQNQLKAK